MGEKTAGDRKIIQGKEKTDEYQRSKRNDNTYAAGVFSERGKRVSAGSTAAATADPDDRTLRESERLPSWNRSPENVAQDWWRTR